MKTLKLVIVATVLLSSNLLFAQTSGLTGFNLHLYRPPVDGSGVFNLYGSEMLEPAKFRIGIVSEASHGLLAATNPVSKQSIRVVNDLMTANVQGALGITSFFEAGINIPVAFFERGTNFNTATSFKTASMGDISLDWKFRLLKDTGHKPGIALVSSTLFPSGDRGKFTGDPTIGEEVKLAIDKKVGPIGLVANAGYRITGRTLVSTLDVDDMLTFGGGMAWTLPFADKSMDLMGEVDGTHVLRASQQLTTPIEWMVGLKKRFGNGLTAQLGGGRSITNGIGGGEWRVVAGLHWSPSFRKHAEEEHTILLDTIYFGFDKDRYSPKYENQIKQVAEKLRNDPKARLRVRGHTDSIGTDIYNLNLSKRRAEKVRESLGKKGIRSDHMTIEAVGRKEPLSDNRTAKGKANNRRVEILKVQ